MTKEQQQRAIRELAAERRELIAAEIQRGAEASIVRYAPATSVLLRRGGAR